MKRTPINRQPRSPFLGRLVGGPAGFRALLERLGPTYVKIGQFLALRPDIVPQEFCDELIRLLDRVDPFPWEQARAIIAEDLGDEPTRLFAAVDAAPLAAGSLAQTHAARLQDGTAVVVKVQRPRVREQVLRDVGRIGILARLLELAGVSPAISPRDVAAELRDWLLQELDMGREVNNMARLHRLAHDVPWMVVPRPYRSLCGPRVVTAERVRGIPLTELLDAGAASDQTAHVRRGEDEVSLERLAENMIFATLTQVFRFRFFHADVHPGNVFALPGNRIGYVDFGLCDELDETLRERQARYLAALYDRNVDAMYTALTELLVPTADADLGAFRAEFVAQTRLLLARTPDDDVSNRANAADERSPIAEWLITVLRAARANGLGLPPRILSLYRTLLTAETVARRISPTADLRTIGREFFSTLRVTEVLGEFSQDEIQAIGLSLVELLHEGPERIRDVLARTDEGTFALPTGVSLESEPRRGRRRRARLAGTAVVAVGIAALIASSEPGHVLGLSLSWPLGLILVLFSGSIAVQVRQLR